MFRPIFFWFFIGALLPDMVSSAEWVSGVSSSSITTSYTENKFLSHEKNKDTWGNVFDAGVFVEGRTEIDLFRLSSDVSLARYTEKSNLDNDASSVNFLARHGWVDYTSGIFVNWNNDTTLTSEFNDTGLVQVRKPRVLKNIKPSFQYDISERLSAAIEFDYSDVEYRGAQSLGLFGYKYKILSTSMNFKLANRQNISSSIYRSELNSPKIDNIVSDLGVKTSYQYIFYPKTVAFFSLGIHQIEVSRVVNGLKRRSAKDGYIGELSLSRNRFISSWKMRLNREISPSGFGYLQQRDRLYIHYLKRFTHMFSGSVSSTFLKNKYIQGNRGVNSRRYFRSYIQAKYRVSRMVELSINYGYKWQETSSAQHGIGSNEIGISVSYNVNNK